MSNIASGIAGVAQKASPAKGNGVAAGAASQGEGFASAIAGISMQGGGQGRKGAYAAAGKQAVAKTAELAEPAARVKMSRIPDAMRKAEFSHALTQDGHPAAAAEGRKAASGGIHGKEASAQVRDEREPAAEGVDAGAVPAAADTDVGNLLAMLGAPALPQEVVASAAVRDGGRRAERQEGRAEGIGKRTEAGAKPEGAAPAAAQELAETELPPASDTDQLFRLVRADGKGKDVDMRLSADGERVTLKDANPAGPRGEAVTVVDARRYIGLAQNGNAAAVTAAITQDPEWTASLGATGDLLRSHGGATGGVVNTLKIQMSPIELGLVTATLRLHGDELVVSLQVETGEAYRQLSDDQDAIVKALRGQGFAVDQVSVQLAPVDRSASSQQQGDGQFQQQFSSQPQAREGDGGRRDGTGQGSGNSGQGGSIHEGSSADGVPGSQSLRSGGVYL